MYTNRDMLSGKTLKRPPSSWCQKTSWLLGKGLAMWWLRPSQQTNKQIADFIHAWIGTTRGLPVWSVQSWRITNTSRLFLLRTPIERVPSRGRPWKRLTNTSRLFSSHTPVERVPSREAPDGDTHRSRMFSLHIPTKRVPSRGDPWGRPTNMSRLIFKSRSTPSFVMLFIKPPLPIPDLRTFSWGK